MDFDFWMDFECCKTHSDFWTFGLFERFYRLYIFFVGLLRLKKLKTNYNNIVPKCGPKDI